MTAAALLIALVVAVVAAGLAVTRAHAVHALLYLVAALLALALVFLLIGAPFAAAFQVIIYAGAIVVLFVFAVMLLGLGRAAIAEERALIPPRAWVGPGLLALALAAALVLAAFAAPLPDAPAGVLGHPAELAAALFGPYLLGVELAGMLLLAGLVGAFHIGRRDRDRGEEEGRG